MACWVLSVWLRLFAVRYTSPTLIPFISRILSDLIHPTSNDTSIVSFTGENTSDFCTTPYQTLCLILLASYFLKLKSSNRGFPSTAKVQYSATMLIWSLEEIRSLSQMILVAFCGWAGLTKVRECESNQKKKIFSHLREVQAQKVARVIQ